MPSSVVVLAYSILSSCTWEILLTSSRKQGSGSTSLRDLPAMTSKRGVVEPEMRERLMTRRPRCKARSDERARPHKDRDPA